MNWKVFLPFSLSGRDYIRLVLNFSLIIFFALKSTLLAINRVITAFFLKNHVYIFISIFFAFNLPVSGWKKRSCFGKSSVHLEHVYFSSLLISIFWLVYLDDLHLRWFPGMLVLKKDCFIICFLQLLILYFFAFFLVR